MSKKKKKKKGKKRELAKVPEAYIAAVADKLHGINPTLQIVYNTLKDVYCNGHNAGYLRRTDDAKFFREKQLKHLNDDWNATKDLIDDTIHPKVETNK